MKKAFQIKIIGVVQGVGFRPFVYRLAKECKLTGWVLNSSEGVRIQIEGSEENLQKFIKRLKAQAPPHAKIYRLEIKEVPIEGFKDFEVIKAKKGGEIELDILPDLGICNECLFELFDKKDRRYRYPFISCVNCGPRFSIIENLPYERENTTMKGFPLCGDCKREYEDPLDRRFHAEPIACPVCGPGIELYSGAGQKIASGEEALKLACKYLKEGKILAIKGLTGFHLMARADDPQIIETLRTHKRRSKKPFAVMFGNIPQLENFVELSESDKELLLSPQAPILLLPDKGLLPKNLNEGLNTLGVFLPYTPLHQLLIKELSFPVIATSGNISDEPIVFENEEALSKLSNIADYFLLHDRPIRRGLDDSVRKRAGDLYIFIRRARGYVPLPLLLDFRIKRVILAVGAQERNTFSLAFKNKIISSQHLGDIKNLKSLSHFERSIYDFLNLYRVRPEIIVSDLHPRYETTRWAYQYAKKEGITFLQLQHHVAHLYSVFAEKGKMPHEEVLGISFDGTGYGLDKTIWGGEFFKIKGTDFERIFSLRPFRLIGGEVAVKDTRRIALSLLFEIFGDEALKLPLPLFKNFEERELFLLYTAWKRGINSPLCSSMGRLFDGISALLGICYYNTYSGEAPMRLESLYKPHLNEVFEISIKKPFYLDWEEVIRRTLELRDSPEVVATAFIKGVAKAILRVAQLVELEKVALSGGVFMNGPLLSETIRLLSEGGFKVLRNEAYPPNDGGISLGQAFYGALLTL
ncbi:carbamoyltransferase [Caldimicrobium thiodismutans]|uniref:Carbamoyltransferase n=1 Tax=Caldimicrobium thiodismutans TaxID=1653476 RepID=A0A0U5AZZ4_9BACT|nr:carbamoyltransferase HypF [Caldimicrobium thiodismutans]BAU23337.1 carbamoyltransferase [Caldimicrobium thiodismutans]